MALPAFLHGVEVIERDTGARPIREIATGVIGLVGTARKGPTQTPTLIAGSRREAVDKFGSDGTIPRALTGILDQAGAQVVVVNVLERTVVADEAVAFVGDALELGLRRADAQLADVVIETAAAAAASKVVGAGNAALTVTAARAGAAGNNITVELDDPGANDGELAVAVAGTVITVALATDASGDITSTNTQVIDAINGSAAAAALVTATLGGGVADTVVAAVAAAALVGGTGRTYTVDADYTVDPATATVTRLGTGAIVRDQAVLASYSYLGDAEAAAVAGATATLQSYTGAYALLQAASLGLPTPRILIAPGWSHVTAVTQALIAVADRLRAIVVADGPDTTDAAAIAHRDEFDSRRLYLVDPGVKVGTPAVVEPASARVAGVIARTDDDRGYWWSPSNQLIAGVVGTKRPVDFRLGDANSRANTLNANEIATIIRENGYRLWGNRTCSSDSKWQFLNIVRIADQVNERILQGHLWAVDRNITKTYLADVVEGVNAFLRELVGVGAIIGGQCWADPDLNTPTEIAAGKATFSFDFTPTSPAERVTFQSILTNDYLEDLV